MKKKKNFKKIFLTIILIFISLIVINIISKMYYNVNTSYLKVSPKNMESAMPTSLESSGFRDGVIGKNISLKKSRSFSKNEVNYDKVVDNNGGGSSEEIKEKVENRKIIKRADLSIVVENIEGAGFIIENKVNSLGGYIASKNFTKYENSAIYNNAYYQIRIPSKYFKEILENFKGIAVKITRENITGEDVTSQYSDTEIRIRTKRKEAERYEELLTKAKDTKAVLGIVRELNRVISEIELEEGRLRSLKSKISMSTISLNLTSKKDVQIGGVIWEPKQEVKESYNNFLGGLKYIANTIIYGIPEVILIVLRIFIFFISFIIGFKITEKLFNIFAPKFIPGLKNFFKVILDKIKEILK